MESYAGGFFMMVESVYYVNTDEYLGEIDHVHIRSPYRTHGG